MTGSFKLDNGINANKGRSTVLQFNNYNNNNNNYIKHICKAPQGRNIGGAGGSRSCVLVKGTTK